MFPFRRAYRGVKSLFQRKKKAAKRAPKRRRARLGKQTGHLTVKKTEIEERIQVTANSTTFGNATFELADLTQYANYISLYEEYRIDKVVFSFKALNNVNTGASGFNALNTLGMIHTRIDTNDAVAPTSIQTMMNDPSYRGCRSSRDHTRVIYPKFMMNAGATQSKQSKGWLSCYNSDGTTISAVSHYGLKWAFEGGINNNGNVVSYVVEPIVTYYISFRNPQ